jgi:threonine dehydratase
MPETLTASQAVSPDVSLETIQAAHARIRDYIYCSPCQYSAGLSKMTGDEVYLKLDNLQRTGAFKERGALNKILTLTEDEKQRGVIAASAGNHAQAVAYHATIRGIHAQIVMPLATPLVKVSATRGYGAHVILHGANYDEAYAEAQRRCAEEGTTFLHPFDDAAVICGQGTMGIEILEQQPDIEAVVIPIGGGGLASGVACAMKELKPSIRVIGVETERLPSMKRAIEAGHPVTLEPEATIADGIAVRRAGDLTLPLIRKYVDEIVLVDEEEIAKAILVLLEQEKTLAQKTSLVNKKTAVLVCGGNIDVTLLARIIERGLVKDGRRVRVRVHLSDRPGALHQLTRILADNGANIVETLHNRAYYGVNLGDTVIDITLETRGPAHITEIHDALTAAQYRHERIQ